ncbi:MAG: thioredoxin domain-containing protein [Thiobacillaceae bacterium]
MARQASPYLALHAQDPVHWQVWGPAVIEAARRDNRLILVSLGYFACHWCHVMQRETWADAGAARFINANFVPVKVDREVNAALDAALQAFSARTRGIAGWPLNVFLTPEGYPLFAIAYAPRDEFLQVARALAERWRREGAALARLAREAAKGDGARAIADLPKAFLTAAKAHADMLRGGFDRTAKFPMSPQLLALLESQARAPDGQIEEFLRLTLQQMRDGGLRDHVGGGFFRYTVDPDWHEPHFEKMLYDNAQLAIVYLRAAEVLREAAYRRIGLETVDFLLNDMTVERGSAARGFVASLSALDDKGREGGGYLWDKEALRRVLDPEALALVTRIWALDRAADFELGYLPQEKRPASPSDRQALAAVHAKLRGLRAQRRVPRDEKVLTGWNGLALAALAAAAALEPRYRPQADALYAFVKTGLWQGDRLVKGVAATRPLGSAELEDYAYLAYGLARYASLSRREDARAFLRQVVQAAWQRFHDGKAFRLEEASLLAGGPADPWEDGATPAPAALLAAATRVAGLPALARCAEVALEQARTGATGNPLGRASVAHPPSL